MFLLPHHSISALHIAVHACNVTSLAALLECLSDNMCRDSLFDPTQRLCFKQACMKVFGSPYMFISPHAYIWSRKQRGLRRTADSGGPLMALPGLLKGLPDMERGITRIFHRTANPAEFVQVLQALVNIAPKLGVQVSCMLPTYGHLQHCQAVSRPEARLASNCNSQAFHGLLQICLLKHVQMHMHLGNQMLSESTKSWPAAQKLNASFAKPPLLFLPLHDHTCSTNGCYVCMVT